MPPRSQLRITLSYIGAFLTPFVSHPCPAAQPVEKTLGVTAESCETRTHQHYQLFRDALYPGAAGEQKADVYLPTQGFQSPRPVLFLIHGGGWAAGDKASPKQTEIAQFAIDEGYVAVAINYSLTKFLNGNPRAEKIRAGWPNNIYDCKCALQWVKQNADTLGINPDKIAVVGSSAGAHLALLLGLSAHNNELNAYPSPQLHDNTVRCVIDFYGVTDVRQFEVYSLLSERDRYNPKSLALASPIEHLSESSPPVLILHGNLDSDVEPAFSSNFAAKAKALNANCETIFIENAGHGFGLQANERDLRPLLRNFLRKYL
ncbi:MAG: alpha/beta hydrolase [Verrucomicrobiota bacterium]